MTINGLVYGYLVNEVSYADKAVIIKEDTKGDSVYVLLEGRVKVKKNTPGGMITVDTLKEGAVFGEMALFDKSKGVRTATALADGPVKVGVMDKDRLEQEFEALSPQLQGLIKTLISRLEHTTKKAILLQGW
jgi:CRP-like cAMP-binding protein